MAPLDGAPRQENHGNLRRKPPQGPRFPQEIAGLIKGNQWLRVPDHKAGYFLGVPRGIGVASLSFTSFGMGSERPLKSKKSSFFIREMKMELLLMVLKSGKLTS